MRVAAFAIVCCALQYVASEIIEEKIHNIFNDRHKYERKNVSTSDEFDVDQKTGKGFEKKTVYTEFVANNDDCDDVSNDDVKIMTFVFKKDPTGQERIYEQDTIIKKKFKPNVDDSTGKGQNSDHSDRDISTPMKKNSDVDSTAETPAKSDQSKTAESQSSVINLIASKPSIVIINDKDAENTPSYTEDKICGDNTEAYCSGQENIDAGEISGPNVYGQDYYGSPFFGRDYSYPEKIVVWNENYGSSGSDTSPNSHASEDSTAKKPTDVALKPSAAGKSHGYKNELGQGGIDGLYVTQVPSIFIENKNQAELPRTSGTTGAGNYGSGSGTKGPEADASPSIDRDAGEISGPNVYGQDYYGSPFFGRDYSYPEKIVVWNENYGSSGSDTSPNSHASEDSTAKKPTDVALKPSAAGKSHGYKNELGQGGFDGPYVTQVPSIFIENKNQAELPRTSGTTGAGNYGSGSGTKGSEADASPSGDRDAGEISGPNVYGQDYYGSPFFGRDYSYPEKIVVWNENYGSSESDTSPNSHASEDSAGKKPTDVALKPSAAGKSHGYKNELGQGGIDGPYVTQVPSIFIENKNQAELPRTSGTTGASNYGSGSGTKGSEADASPSGNRDAGEISGPNVYGQDYYGSPFFGRDYSYPKKIVVWNENYGSSGSDTSPNSHASEDSAAKKPTDVALKPSAAGKSHGYKNELGQGGIDGPYVTQVPSIFIENKNQAELPRTSGTTGAGNYGSGSGTKGSEADASPSGDRDAGEISGPNVYGQDYYGSPFFGRDYSYPKKIVVWNENYGSSGSDTSPNSHASEDSAAKKPTDVALKPSAAGKSHGYKNELGQGGIDGPYVTQVPSIFIENKNQAELPRTSGTTGAGNYGSGSGTKGSEADASPTGDRDAGEISGPNVYGQDYYGSPFFGRDYSYPEKIVVWNENYGSSGSDTSPNSHASEDSTAKKPTNVALKPSVAGKSHGYKNELGQGGIDGPYVTQVPSIFIENKNQAELPRTSGTTGAGNYGSGSGTKGPEADASPSIDRDAGEISGPNVYGQDYYGSPFFGRDYSYPEKIVVWNENYGSSGSDTSPNSHASEDSTAKKPTDVALKPSAAGKSHGYKNELGQGGFDGPYVTQVPSIFIENKNQAELPRTSGTTGAGNYGSGSGTKGSEADASPSGDRDAGEISGPNVYGQDYYGSPFFGRDYSYPEKIVVWNENYGSSESDTSANSHASEDSAGKKPTDVALKPSAAGKSHGYKNELGQGGIDGPYVTQVPSIFIENKNQAELPRTSGTTGAGNYGRGSETKGSEADASPSGNRDAGEISGPNVYGQDYYGSPFFGRDYSYPEKILVWNENYGSSGLDTSPNSHASEDSTAKKPTNVALKPSAAGKSHGYNNELGQGGIDGPYVTQVPSIFIENKNQAELPKTSGTTGAGNYGSGSGTKGPEADASPSIDRDAGEISGPNVYGQDYYGSPFFGRDYSYPEKIVVWNENYGSSGLDTSPNSHASEDSTAKKPTNVALKPSAAGKSHGYNNELGQGGIDGPYVTQVPSIFIENKNQAELPRTSGTTGAGNYGRGSETKGSEADASPSGNRDAGEISGPNVYGQDYYGSPFFGRDYSYPEKILVWNENYGSSGLDTSPNSHASEDSTAKKPTNVALKPSAAGKSHGYNNELGQGGIDGPYVTQVPSIFIENKNQAELPKTSGTTGAGNYGSGSGTKGPEADASPSIDRDAGEISGPNVYGQDYYGSPFFGRDYSYPEKIVVWNENYGSSGSDTSPNSHASEDSAAKKPTDVALKPSAAGKSHGYKNELGQGGFDGPYVTQVPSIFIENKNQAELPRTSGTTGAGNYRSGSGTKGSEADASLSGDRDAGEISGPNVYGQDYYGSPFFWRDYSYPEKIVVWNENYGSLGSDTSPNSHASEDSIAKKPTDVALKPSAAGKSHGYKNEMGQGGIDGPYVTHVPSIVIENKNQAELPRTSGTTGAGNYGSGSGTKGSEADASPSGDRDAGEISGPNIYGQDYYGSPFFGRDYSYPEKIVVWNENYGSSESDTSPNSHASEDSAAKKPTDVALKPSAAGKSHGYKNELGQGGIDGPYITQVPSIFIENKNQAESPRTSGTTGAGNYGSGSGTKGSEADASPSGDRDAGEISGPNVYGQDYYGSPFFGRDYSYPEKIVVWNENYGSSGSDTSPNSHASEDSTAKKPTNVALKPSAAGKSHGYKNELGQGGIDGPYVTQVPSIFIENKNQAELPRTSGTTGAGNYGSGSGTKGSEADASPTGDRDAGEISGPNVYGQDYYGSPFFGRDYSYPEKIVVWNENYGSSESDTSPNSHASEDSAAKKPTDVALKPSAAGKSHGYKNELGQGGIDGPYVTQVPSIFIENKNQAESPRTSGTTGAGNYGSGSGTKGSEADASPSGDRDAGEISGPNVYGQDYYGSPFFGRDYSYPEKIVVWNENYGSSGSDTSPNSHASEDSTAKKPTNVALKPSAAGKSHGYKNELGQGGIDGPYVTQVPSIFIENKNQAESPRTSGTTGAGNYGSGSGTKGPEADASPSIDRDAGEISGPNVYGQDYYGSPFFGRDYSYPEKIVVWNENYGSSESDTSPNSHASEDSTAKKPTDVALKPSAAGKSHGYKNELGQVGFDGPYVTQVPSIFIENKNQAESPRTSGTTGADNYGSGSGTKGSEADASLSGDRDAGEISGPNVYGQDYYGSPFFGRDYSYPKKFVVWNENYGSSGSDTSPNSHASEDSAAKKPTDVALKPSAAGKSHGYKNELGQSGIDGPYVTQVPSIFIENKNQAESPRTSGTTGAGNYGSGSGTKGSEADASPTGDRDAGEISGPNVYGQDYYGSPSFGRDYSYPKKFVVWNENYGSSGSDTSPNSHASEDSAAKKPTDVALKPSAAGKSHGYKNELGQGGVDGPYVTQVPSIFIENKNQAESPRTSGTTGAGNYGSGSGTKGSEADASPSGDRDAGEISGPNVYGQDYYGSPFFGRDYSYPKKIVVWNENYGSSGSDTSPNSHASEDSAAKKSTDVALKPSAAGKSHGYKNELGQGGIDGPYVTQVPSIFIENKNQAELPRTSGTTGADNYGSGSGTKGSEADASPSEDRDAGEISVQRMKRVRQACRLRRRQYFIRLGRKGQSCEGC